MQIDSTIVFSYFYSGLHEFLLGLCLWFKYTQIKITNRPWRNFNKYHPRVHPTTAKIFALFENVSTYIVKRNSRVAERYHDDLAPVQLKVLALLGIREEEYWASGKLHMFT